MRAVIKLSRKFSFYLIRWYAPTVLITSATFIGMWIPYTVHSARVSSVLSPSLSLIMMHNNVNNEVRVSYVVAIHIWMFSCMFITLMGLIEYASILIIEGIKSSKLSLLDKLEKKLKAQHKKTDSNETAKEHKTFNSDNWPDCNTTQQTNEMQMKVCNDRGNLQQVTQNNVINCMERGEERRVKPVSFDDDTYTDMYTDSSRNSQADIVKRDDDRKARKRTLLIQRVKQFLDHRSRPEKNKGGHKKEEDMEDLMEKIAKKKKKYKPSTTPHAVDRVCRLLYPSFYIFFILGYFVYYTTDLFREEVARQTTYPDRPRTSLVDEILEPL